MQLDVHAEPDRVHLDVNLVCERRAATTDEAQLVILASKINVCVFDAKRDPRQKHLFHSEACDPALMALAAA